ncbi:MBL fold metallo-hydrolase [Prevotella copri]|uniref:MBL fold metallo-hydrolase n=1 Tax=Segatella copri TaxID=165179 RepID=A0AAW4NBV2_9BACT|nr:MBL fold metallo-hydrolase [Segatella copri]MBU9911113.1 MBL fold metallo-hydrolase [Segatella copri]MBV3398890.1 MBL fold metallo-hydrolase [Segatella copri]MBV3408463.1 MBL fold metallo-hydrolase [Segatella copri]MBV3411331.1 MBL fold metallo-hydrolase [Segatella copri]MBV3419844.1 MBL fold metallo-hydrolase [Segatella copri]
MDKTTTQITMLGTGNATVSQIYNTCFLLKTPSTLMLVDAGGGNGILAQLKKVNVQISDIHHLFVTHAHTDHVLGVIWVIRMVAQCKGYEGLLHVYGNDKVMKVIKTIIDMILAKKQLAKVAERVVFHQLEDGDSFEVGDMKLECFDIQSTKEKQFGFRAELPSSSSSDESDKPLVLACLGDEPYNEQNRRYIVGADWMMCEAFCLYADRDTFKPYEKCHSTALDAGKLAEELGVKNLILYHTEEKTLANRKENYTREAAENFKGRIFVPDDLEVIEL